MVNKIEYFWWSRLRFIPVRQTPVSCESRRGFEPVTVDADRTFEPILRYLIHVLTHRVNSKLNIIISHNEQISKKYRPFNKVCAYLESLSTPSTLVTIFSTKTYACSIISKPFTPSAGAGKVRPADQIRPAYTFCPPCGVPFSAMGTKFVVIM